MRTFTIAQLEAWAAQRPEGYLADVLSHAQRNGDQVLLDEKNYRRLRQKYNPVATWPATPFGLAMRLMKPLRIEGEAGAGDTLARLIGPVGGDAYKAWYQKTFGKSCGCVERQADLNRQYPYEKTHEDT